MDLKASFNPKTDLDLNAAIGQMIVVGFHGTGKADPWVQTILKQIEAGKIAGVLLFRYNITSQQQLLSLTSDINGLRPSLLPFVLVDQEGGRVQRLSSSNGFNDYFSAKSVADKLTVSEAEEYYFNLGQELRDLGINWNFAPCLDLHAVENNPPCQVIGGLERSYSCDATVVAQYGGSMVRGLRRAGVLSCLKHFPGHGSSQGDTHQDLFDVTSTWNEVELAPYRRLIAEGGIDAVMTAHLINAQGGSPQPATLSSEWIGKLRGDLGFKGVVVTDDLHMGAIQRHYSLEETIIRAVNASVDLLIFSNNPAAAKGAEGFMPDPELPEKIAEIILEAVQSGQIKENRIWQSVERIVELKKKIGAEQ